MGDMADYIMDSQFPNGPEEDWENNSLGVKCKYCDKGYFIWLQKAGKWRLYEDGGKRIHLCKAYLEGK